MSAYVTSGVRAYVRELSAWGTEPNPEKTQNLTEALTAADEGWGVQFTPGPVLSWIGFGGKIKPNSELTPEMLCSLASAVEGLNKRGYYVTAGQSARGITYLNIRPEAE
jgi:hypothetical protein